MIKERENEKSYGLGLAKFLEIELTKKVRKGA